MAEDEPLLAMLLEGVLKETECVMCVVEETEATEATTIAAALKWLSNVMIVERRLARRRVSRRWRRY